MGTGMGWDVQLSKFEAPRGAKGGTDRVYTQAELDKIVSVPLDVRTSGKGQDRFASQQTGTD